MTVRIDLQEVHEALELRQRINHAELEDIQFHMHGKDVVIDPKEIEQWRFTGLNNFDFALEVLYDWEVEQITEVNPDE